ncbi:MAG: hypothetical protein MUF49_08095 [Oculatellaceae cyanobacterium Prado106]|nr:hypothetical protein [Oculatellaceae cyanobacterium Prado106]
MAKLFHGLGTFEAVKESKGVRPGTLPISDVRVESSSKLRSPTLLTYS